MNSSLPFRPLGKSDLMITPIGLGCWQFSHRQNLAGKFWPNLNDDLISHIVKISREGGINWFDTAEAYGNGASERALSESLTENGIKPGEVTVATKWWPMFRTASNITRTIDKRLSALTPFPIDLYQVHQPWGFSSEKAEMEAMAHLARDHKIRCIGVSNFSANKMRSSWEVLQKHGIHLISNQVRYSLLDRSIEANGTLQTAKELGISIIAYSPLAQGMVTGKFHDDPNLLKNVGFRRYTRLFHLSGLEKTRPVIEKIRELAGRYNVTPSQVALNWLIFHHGETVVAIPGATREQHAKENAGAMNFRMSDDDHTMLDRISAPFIK